MIEATEFLDTIFDSKSDDDETVLICRQTKVNDGGMIAFPYSAELLKRWKRTTKPTSTYFCVSTSKKPEAEADGSIRWKRRKSDCVSAYVLVLDDIGTKVEEEPPVGPTYKMETSPGNFQWGYILEDYDDLDKYEAYYDAIAKLGFTDEGAGGRNRIMRIPGSINTKEGRDNFESKITLWEPKKWFKLEGLALKLGVPLEEVQRINNRVDKTVVKGPVTWKGTKLAVADPLMTWLQDEGHTQSDINDDGFVWVTCPWSDKHTEGGDDRARYSPLGYGSEEWVQTRGFNCFHAHCKGKLFKEFNEWAVGHGGPSTSGYDPLPWLQAKYVYVADGMQVADMEQRPHGGLWKYKLEEWSNLHSQMISLPGRTRSVKTKTAFLDDSKTTKAIRFAYDPTQDQNPTFKRNDQLIVNTYIPPIHKPMSPLNDVPKRFVEHIKFLAPLKGEADLVLDWLAYWVQCREKRCYALVMVAEDTFGVGRSWLGKMCALLEPDSVGKTSLSALIGRGTQADANYNDWMVGTRLLIIDEAKDTMTREDFYKGYDTFKQNVDLHPTPIRINEKYGKTRDDMMYFTPLIFTNHADAMAIPEDDRRVLVITNPKEKRGLQYYSDLQDALDTRYAARVFWYLKRRDLSKFIVGPGSTAVDDGKGNSVYPAKTEGKRHMIESNASPMDQILDHVTGDAKGDLVTQKSLGNMVRRGAGELNMQDMFSGQNGDKAVRYIWKKIGNLRGERNGARYFIDTKQLEVRAIRNKDKWKKEDSDNNLELIKDELKKNTDNVNILNFNQK